VLDVTASNDPLTATVDPSTTCGAFPQLSQTLTISATGLDITTSGVHRHH
jgi:hypothetical protein